MLSDRVEEKICRQQPLLVTPRLQKTADVALHTKLDISTNNNAKTLDMSHQTQLLPFMVVLSES